MRILGLLGWAVPVVALAGDPAALRDLLLGNKPAPVAKARPSSSLKDFYENSGKRDAVPRARRDAPAEEGGPVAAGPTVSKVLARAHSTFAACVVSHPAQGGRVNLEIGISAQGKVENARIDRPEIEHSGLGDCLKSAARKLVFSSDLGDPVEVSIPLVLG